MSKSVLRKLVESLDYEDNVSIIKEKSISYITEQEIKDSDRRKMIFEIGRITDKDHLFRYIYNAMLKYEGLGVF